MDSQPSYHNNSESLVEDILKNYEENKLKGNTEIIVVPKAGGREIWVVNTPEYCMKLLEMEKGYRVSRQRHLIKDETLLLYTGHLIMEHEGKKWEMYPGNVQRVKPGEVHRFTSLEHSIIIESSTHHEDADTIRLELSGKVDLNNPLYQKYKLLCNL